MEFLSRSGLSFFKSLLDLYFATKSYVNKAISTNTGKFWGTFNDIADLQEITGSNGDYAYVIVPEDYSTSYDRYKWQDGQWVYEYTVGGEAFDDAQWAAINSGITASDKARLTEISQNIGNQSISEMRSDIDAERVHADSLIFDVTKKNSGATFASLSALLSSPNLSTLIPTAVRTGGMTIRFAQSSDNKYVQYRLMSDTFSTTVTDWQGVDDEPTAGSENLIKSGGVYKSIYDANGQIIPYTGMEKTYTIDITSASQNLNFWIYDWRIPNGKTVYVLLSGSSGIFDSPISMRFKNAAGTNSPAENVSLNSQKNITVTDDIVSIQLALNNSHILTTGQLTLKIGMAGTLAPITWVENKVLQGTGPATNSWMSQKATTDAINAVAGNVSSVNEKVALIEQNQASEQLEYNKIYVPEFIANTGFEMFIYCHIPYGESAFLSLSDVTNNVIDSHLNVEVFGYDNTGLFFPKLYVGGGCVIKSEVTGKDVAYIRLSRGASGILSNGSGTIQLLKIKENNSSASIRTIKGWEHGKLVESAVIFTPTAADFNKFAVDREFVPVKRGDLVYVDEVQSMIDGNRGPYWSVNVAEFSEQKQSSFVSISGYIGNKLQSPKPQFKYRVQNDGYIRVGVNKKNRNNQTLEFDISEIPNVVIVRSNIPDFFKFPRVRKIVSADILYKRTDTGHEREESGVLRVANDITFVGNNLWSFQASEEAGGVGPIWVINPLNGELVETKTQDFNHCNCMDYNPNNDTLLGNKTNGESTYGTLILYKNPNGHTDLRLSDADCIQIPLVKSGDTDKILGQFCWCDSDDTLIGFEFHFDGRKMWKLKLGMGSNDLSQNGYGTFISGKAYNEYNGTAMIIHEYKGDIIEKVDTLYDYTHGYRGGAQGMCYDGYLYLMWGLSGHNLLVIDVDDYSLSYKIINNYMHYFDDSNSVDASPDVNFEPEGVCIKDSKIYTASRHAIMSTIDGFNINTETESRIIAFDK